MKKINSFLFFITVLTFININSSLATAKTYDVVVPQFNFSYGNYSKSLIKNRYTAGLSLKILEIANVAFDYSYFTISNDTNVISGEYGNLFNYKDFDKNSSSYSIAIDYNFFTVDLNKFFVVLAFHDSITLADSIKYFSSDNSLEQSYTFGLKYCYDDLLSVFGNYNKLDNDIKNNFNIGFSVAIYKDKYSKIMFQYTYDRDIKQTSSDRYIITIPDLTTPTLRIPMRIETAYKIATRNIFALNTVINIDKHNFLLLALKYSIIEHNKYYLHSEKNKQQSISFAIGTNM